MKTVIKGIFSAVMCAMTYVIAIAAGFMAGPMVHDYCPDIWNYIQTTVVNVIAVIYDGDAFAAAGLLLQLPWIVNMLIGLLAACAVCMVYAACASKD